MAKLGISTGSVPNDGTGDSLLSGAIKINSNFNEIYSAIGDGTNITNRIAYASTSGFSTTSGYATTSGTSNYSTNSGFSTYSSLSGIATAANYANTSGISTVAQFAQDLTGTPNISVGVLTASSYYGNASTLSGIITSIVAGTNVSVSLTGNVATISASGTGGGGTSSQWLSVVSGIVTSSNVGIGTTIANSALQVNNGTISLTGTPGSDIAISLRDNHRITFGDSGISDSSVFFDGTNLNIRTSGSVNISDTSGRDVFSAVAGEGAILYYDDSKKFQTLTDGAYVNGNLGVLGIATATNLNVSGVSTLGGIVINSTNPALSFQTPTDNDIFSISYNTNNDDITFYYRQSGGTGGSQVIWYIPETSSFVLRNPAVDEKLAQFTTGGSVELFYDGSKKFQTIGAGVTVTGTTFTNQLSVSGVITATSFIGDGSGLTGVVASGSGESYWSKTAAGIHTLSSVGIGTTNPRTTLQIENVYGIDAESGTFPASAGVPYTGNSWTISSTNFRTAEYTLWFQHTNGIQSQKVLIINNGTTAYFQEYAITYTNTPLVSIGATIQSGVAKLLWTPESGVSGTITYRFTRETML
jgi:hypothetical protein